MALIKFNKAKISGISAAIPRNIIKCEGFSDVFSKDEVDRLVKKVGLSERRFVNDDVCTSDLCFEAAEKLISEMNIDRNSIDMLIFLSQTGDYKIPFTSNILQDRLGLSKTTAGIDINLGCSGYVYSLSTAFAYLNCEGINRVLLLAGDTMSKIISKNDRSTSLLFGDGASATLIDKCEDKSESFFSLNSDGSGANAIKIKAGAYRYPSDIESLKNKKFDDGSIRNDHQLQMDGVEVFNFTVGAVCKDIKKVIEFSGNNIDDIDFLVLHQSNKFMMDFFVKKLKITKEKVPYSIHKYGNTSTASIPLNIVSELKGNLGNKKIALCGYGAGLSWASCVFDIKNCYISELIEI